MIELRKGKKMSRRTPVRPPVKRDFTVALHVILAAVLCIAFSSVGGQEWEPQPGANIRFRIGPSDSLHVAQLGLLTRDSLALERCLTCNRLRYTRAEINDLAVFRPVNRGDRLIGGFAIGAVIGAGLGYLSARSCRTYERCDLAALNLPLGAISGGLLGMAIGLISAYRWEPVGPNM